MNFLQALFQTAHGVFSNLKGKTSETLTLLKKSTEGFIGEVIIRSALARLKSGAIHLIENIDSPTAENAHLGSTNHMVRGLSAAAQTRTLPPTSLEGQFFNILSEAGTDVKRRVKDALKTKLEHLNPDEGLTQLSALLNTTLPSLETQAQPATRTEAQQAMPGINEPQVLPNFKLEASIQLLSIILLVLSSCALTFSLTQTANRSETPLTPPRPTPAEETPEAPSARL